MGLAKALKCHVCQGILRDRTDGPSVPGEERRPRLSTPWRPQWETWPLFSNSGVYGGFTLGVDRATFEF